MVLILPMRNGNINGAYPSGTTPPVLILPMRNGNIFILRRKM